MKEPWIGALKKATPLEPKPDSVRIKYSFVLSLYALPKYCHAPESTLKSSEYDGRDWFGIGAGEGVGVGVGKGATVALSTLKSSKQASAALALNPTVPYINGLSLSSHTIVWLIPPPTSSPTYVLPVMVTLNAYSTFLLMVARGTLPITLSPAFNSPVAKCISAGVLSPYP